MENGMEREREREREEREGGERDGEAAEGSVLRERSRG